MPPIHLHQTQKYHNRTAEYAGRIYHSTKEANYAKALDMMRRASNPHERVVDVEPQHVVDVYLDGTMLTLKKTGVKVFRIIPDFLVTYADRQEIHEVKGHQTQEWKLKWQLFSVVMAAEQPGIGLFVF